MQTVQVEAVRSAPVYQRILEAPQEQKNELYRYELMKPFEEKWACYRVPLKAAKPGGYDVVMASGMLGHLLPEKLREEDRAGIALLGDDGFWKACQSAVERSLHCFLDAGISLPVSAYRFTVLLADPDNPYMKMSENYSGDGGIPGYLFGCLVPSVYTMARLPVALAHETNHNVRFQFQKWRNDITLGEMIVSEGLAENFAVSLYGEALAGPWVTKTSLRELHEYSKPIIQAGLGVQGFDQLTAYLYGDELAKLQNYFPVGLPYCAGYACGYHLVRHYLKRTGKSVVEATLLPAAEILSAAADFWEEEPV